MKRITIGLALFILAGCHSQKPVTSVSLVDTVKQKKGETHLIVIKKDSVLDIKTDAFGGRYFNLKPHPGKSVISYSYDQGHDPELPDSGYHEAIHFEIDNEKPEVELSGRELAKANVLFGRWCFCPKGTVGNFPVYDGKLSIVREGKKLRVRLNFNVPETTQVINQIDAVLK